MKIALAFVLASGLSGCAYRDLKAPCAPDEGKPLAYADTIPAPQPFAGFDACGPMMPINRGAADGRL